MSVSAKDFYRSPQVTKAGTAELIDLFMYHLTIDMALPCASANGLTECFGACDLRAPRWLASHLSKGLKSNPVRYVRKEGGYRLEQRYSERIARILGIAEENIQTATSLRQLEARVPAGPKRDFLHETIDCFSVRAYRAAVVMCWNLALHHLQRVVFKNHLSAFNSVLKANTDRSVKLAAVTAIDDFTDLKESKFLLFCREARIVSGPIYNKLSTKLKERNDAAHPSGIAVPASVARAYIDDLVENIILKFAE